MTTDNGSSVRWAIGIAVSLLGAGGGIVALLTYFGFGPMARDTRPESTPQPPAAEAPPADQPAPPEPASPGPLPDFEGGSTPVYSAVFSQWPTPTTEHGSIAVEHGTYVLRPNSNTWIGPGRLQSMPPLDGDFVIDLHFRIVRRESYAAVEFSLSGTGADAPGIQTFVSVWSNDMATYGLQKTRLKDDFWLVRQSLIAERERLPSSVARRDWSRGGKVTLKRDGGKMHFFVNDVHIAEFGISRFTVQRLALGAAFASEIEVTIIEAREP